MRGIEVSLVIATVIALAAGGYLVVSNQQQEARLQAVAAEIAALREQQEGAKEAVSTPASPAAKGAVSDVLAPEVAATNALADRLAELAELTEKLEAAAKTLDTRITRSRLAIPSDAERKAQIERARTRLAELRKSADEAREKARQIAASANVPFDVKLLLEPGAIPALEAKPDFVAARDAAAAQARVVASFEKKLADLQFSSVVEALPPEDGR